MIVGIDTDFLVRLTILEHPQHEVTCELRDRHLDRGDRFALMPQVVSEFVHVVSDPRRFEKPVAMNEALRLSRNWWNAQEVEKIFPTQSSLELFLDWMTEYQLGRKRVLDTQLAATCVAAGVTHLITGNAADYRIFPELELIEM